MALGLLATASAGSGGGEGAAAAGGAPSSNHASTSWPLASSWLTLKALGTWVWGRVSEGIRKGDLHPRHGRPGQHSTCARVCVCVGVFVRACARACMLGVHG